MALRTQPAARQDAMFLHTGWGRLWGTENERYTTGEPGPGLALAECLPEAQDEAQTLVTAHA